MLQTIRTTQCENIDANIPHLEQNSFLPVTLHTEYTLLEQKCAPELDFKEENKIEFIIAESSSFHEAVIHHKDRKRFVSTQN